MNSAIEKLWELSRELRHLECAAELLDYDAQISMPPRATVGRGEQSAILQTLIHQRLSSDSLGRLLAEAERSAEANSFPNAQMLRFFHQEYEKVVKVPASFTAKEARLSVQAQQAWESAKQQNNFAEFAPYLEQIFDLQREYSEFFDYPHIYDALLNRYEAGFSADSVIKIMQELRAPQSEIVRLASQKCQAVVDMTNGRSFDFTAQAELSQLVAKLIGFSFESGTLAETEHPFTATCGVNDVRITTKYCPNNLSSLFSTMHESGHAIYEQGIEQKYIDSLAAAPQSLVLHESQSRLWENMVGRSPEFLNHLFPTVKRLFPEVFTIYNEHDFAKAVNIVQPSLIRTDADEATYNMHIMIRFELELALLNRELSVKELPEAWRAKMAEYLGVVPERDSEGVLQDVHWSCGLVGYFPTYLLGNLASAQIYAESLKRCPSIPAQLALGNTATLRELLTENIYKNGGFYTAQECLNSFCGEGLQVKPYLDYLRRKFL